MFCIEQYHLQQVASVNFLTVTALPLSERTVSTVRVDCLFVLSTECPVVFAGRLLAIEDEKKS